MNLGNGLRVDLHDPNDVKLYRLFRHPKGEWEAPPPEYRNLRVDPPDGHKDDYAVLYLASSLSAAAIECRIFEFDDRDKLTWKSDKATEYKVARYQFAKPALFISLDEASMEKWGLAGENIAFGKNLYDAIQRKAWELHRDYHGVVHGLSWPSFHRNRAGYVFALWHEHKSTIGLTLDTSVEMKPLIQDAEWLAFLSHRDHHHILRIDPAPPDHVK